LHGLNLTHTDLKPENILLKIDEAVKDTDLPVVSKFQIII
jgi:serine/threonine protein kinase